MKRMLCSSLILLFLAAPSLAADRQMTVLIHVTRSLTKHDARTIVLPHLISTLLKQGSRVQVLFDDEGVAAVTIGHWYGGHTTPLDKTNVSGEARNALSALLGVPANVLPGNYGDLLRFLKGKGAELYVNSLVLDLRGLGNDRFDHAATPVSVEEMGELLGTADVIVPY